MTKHNHRFLMLLCVAFFTFIVVRNAWTSDDAYITFRSIENFLAGYGPVYNPAVRVQSFTHPAWMLFLSGVYLIAQLSHLTFGNGLVFPTLFISILLSAGAIYLAMSRLIRQELAPLLLFASPVILSRAFVDYSTSGLENPLTHFLLILFLWKFFSDTENLFSLAFIAALLVLNRMDALLLVGPALLYCFWLQRSHWRGNLTVLLAGFLPFLLWELFSLFYYGFLFPNTAYAKLNTGISGILLIMQGLDYVLNSIHWDPITLFVIAFAGIGVALEKDRKSMLLYAGILLYFLYTIKIGGDFMSGRFFAASLLISAVLISRLQTFAPQYTLVGLAMMIALGIFSFRSTLSDPLEPLIAHQENGIFDQNGISDERLFYFDGRRNEGLVMLGFRDLILVSPYAAGNWKYTHISKIELVTTLGKIGYVRGPDIYVMDNTALTDALLARLPVGDPVHWRIGHFSRKIPTGYLETIRSGTNKIADPDLAQYYQKLSSVISGPLWSWDRLLEIWRFNSGQYDHFVKAYASRLRP